MNSRQPSLEDGLETKVLSTYISSSGQQINGKTMIMERLRERIHPKGRNQRNKYKSDLDHFRQTTKSFSEFWTELKRKFELAKNKSTGYNDNRNCSVCLDCYMGEN